MKPQVKTTLEVCGGMTESIFPEVETWLLEASDHQEALKYVASRKNMNRYRSMVDFLFCEIYTEYRSSCFWFYKKGEGRLGDFVSKEHLAEYERVMLLALKIALEAYLNKESMNWNMLLPGLYGIRG